MKNRNSLISFSSVLLCFFAAPTFANAASLSLQDYLSQVKKTSPALQASSANIEGAPESAKESDLITMPKLSFQGTHSSDQRKSNSPFYGKTVADNYSLGVEKLFDFGLSSKLSYSLLNNNTTNLPAAFFPGGSSKYAQGQVSLDLSQSLWRNFLGAETKATESLSEASSLALLYSEKFKMKQLIAQAESAYHRLAIANELVKLQNELLTQSKKILDWNTRRVQNHLTDKIDMLQSKAAYQARELELASTLTEQRSALLAFNTIRNQGSESNENVELLSSDAVLALADVTKSGDSDDVKAAEQNERIQKANQELSLQKSVPDLSLIGSLAYNGLEPSTSPAVTQSFTTNNPYYLVGLKLSVPLYFWETSQMRSGRVKQQLAAEQNTIAARLNNDQSFSDLSRKLNEAKSRFKLVNELVDLQKEKLEYEKYRYNLGRTTTYQVLVFEQDYAQSLISRLKLEQEILSTHSQLKTYSAE